MLTLLLAVLCLAAGPVYGYDGYFKFAGVNYYGYGYSSPYFK
jgi:hypothetical protein